MKTLGRILFLLLAIAAGLWVILSAYVAYLDLQKPDQISAAAGALLVPLLLFIVCVHFFRKLGAPAKTE